MRLFFTGKLILFITIPLVILAMLALFSIKETLKESGMQQLKAHMLELVQHYAANVSSELDKSVTITNTTALYLASNPLKESDTHYALLRNNLSQNKVIYGAAIAYEENYFPNKRIYSPYVFRYEDGSLREMDIATSAYDYTQPQWQWFHDPKKEMEGVWSEPYFDEGAGDVLMITYSAPIVVSEKFAGVVTADIDLNALHETLNLKGLTHSSYVILTNTGHFAYHTKKSLIGQSFLNIADNLGLEKSIYIARKMITGERGYIEIENDKGEAEMVFFSPIGDYGWSFALSISKKHAQNVVFEDQNMTQIWLLAILLIGVTLSSVVSYYSFLKPLKNLEIGVQSLRSESTRIMNDIEETPPFERLTHSILALYHQFHDKLLKQTKELEEANSALKDEKAQSKYASKRVRGLLSAAQNSVVIINSMGEIVATNYKSETILKLKMKNMIGESILSFVDEPDKQRFSNMLEEMFADISEKTLEDIVIVTRSQVKHHVNAHMKPVFISEDVFECNIVFIKDV